MKLINYPHQPCWTHGSSLQFVHLEKYSLKLGPASALGNSRFSFKLLFSALQRTPRPLWRISPPPKAELTLWQAHCLPSVAPRMFTPGYKPAPLTNCLTNHLLIPAQTHGIKLVASNPAASSGLSACRKLTIQKYICSLFILFINRCPAEQSDPSHQVPAAHDESLERTHRVLVLICEAGLCPGISFPPSGDS